MAWNYTTSKDRIQKHLDGMGEIKVEKLTRDANLNTLLSETCCREIYGAHVYAHVSNFAHLASRHVEDEGAYKQFIRSVHIYQREVGRIVEDVLDGVRVHFQGAKLHALFFRPIDDGIKISAKAVLLELVIKDFLASVFNPAFPEHSDYKIATGADLGTTIGTRNGSHGDRELLFLGAPANHAAKIIGPHNSLRVTKRIYDALPDDLRGECTAVAGAQDLYELRPMTAARLDELASKYGIGWDREASKKRVEADKELYPLSRIAYSGADALIDVDSLSIHDNKHVMSASVYGDVTGFTAHIDAAQTDVQKRDCLKQFHAIRKEMAHVVRDDFNAVRIQFQGDRVQAIVHLPKNDEAGIAAEAVDLAIGLQSSLEKTLRACLTGISGLHLAVGVDQGTTLISNLGTRGHRDRICLGEPVEDAAATEERCKGQETGVSKRVYDALPERLKKHFKYSADRCCYVAENLTADKVEQAEKASSLYGGRAPVYVKTGAGGAAISAEEAGDARKVSPAQSYRE